MSARRRSFFAREAAGLTVECFDRLPHPAHDGYTAHGGLLRDEAIMVLRRFYITENTNGTLAWGCVFLRAGLRN